MIPRLKDAEYRGEYRVWLRFADGSSGEVDLHEELWGEVFEPLRDQALFAQLRADPELETLVWSNGADFAPEFLYEKLLSTGSTKAPRQIG